MRYSIVFLCVIISVKVLAQDIYAPGYVALETGDTITGEVAYLREGFANVQFLNKIKVRSGRKTYKYHISQVISYRSGDEKFIRVRWAPAERIAIVTNYYRILPYGGEQVYLRVLKDGGLSIYEYQWIDGMDDYISSFPLFKKEGQNLMVRATQGVLGLKRRVLIEYFSDCPELQKALEEGRFDLSYQVADFYELQCQ